MAEHQHHAHEHHHQSSPSRGLHKDWRAWVVVSLMLAAMAAYILSFDEEDAPGAGPDALEVPAAAETAE